MSGVFFQKQYESLVNLSVGSFETVVFIMLKLPHILPAIFNSFQCSRFLIVNFEEFFTV